MHLYHANNQVMEQCWQASLVSCMQLPLTTEVPIVGRRGHRVSGAGSNASNTVVPSAAGACTEQGCTQEDGKLTCNGSGHW